MLVCYDPARLLARVAEWLSEQHLNKTVLVNPCLPGTFPGTFIRASCVPNKTPMTSSILFPRLSFAATNNHHIIA